MSLGNTTEERLRSARHAVGLLTADHPERLNVPLYYTAAKRILDILISLVVLLITSPIMFYIATIIWRHFRVSPVFAQTRIGQGRPRSSRRRLVPAQPNQDEAGRCRFAIDLTKTNGPNRERRANDLPGRPFTFYKFRTMYPDARERFPDLYAYDYDEERLASLKFKAPHDPRVPPWAEWMRKSSLDELPNFWNVLIGQMSVVGPRPEIPEMVKYYRQDQELKFQVKPGVTGLAQIEGRGHLTFQETVAYDLDYVKHRSLWLDLKIIAKTLWVTIVQDGAF